MSHRRFTSHGPESTVDPSHAAIPESLGRRVIVDNIRPRVDDGRFPIKRTVGESVEVRAEVFADGHDVMTVLLLDRHTHLVEQVEGGGTPAPGAGARPDRRGSWRETEMTLAAPGTDEWTARFEVDALGWHEYTVIGWVDRFKTWRRDLEIKTASGQDVGVELLEGALMIREAVARTPERESRRSSASSEAVLTRGGGAPREQEKDVAWLLSRADALGDSMPRANRVSAALDDELATRLAAYADRSRATAGPTLRVWVDRERARFGAWYELFPRSAGPDARRSGTFREAAALLPRVADLGFDVVYLPPIHPIGKSFRKGANNSLSAGANEPGSPWAIGSEHGGHTAIEPGLGTLEDFIAFRTEAERLGLEVALDLAWQCSPDHPWVREHPEWFRHRPDGTIKYAENPPKKYQDIYPLDFENEDWRALWQALLDVTRFWIERGVRIFRVDNPHTKTFGFWEWWIDRIHAEFPDVILLSEAFTRPTLMRRLAKEGFTQSYTYFTWRNSKEELTEHLTELTATGVREYLRPNLFANTPDILHAYLQHGGRPAFEARLLLAATLGASYGIYSGFELCEARAIGPGSEEYADSEKFQFKKRQWDAPGNINELVCRVNAIRRAEPALHGDWTLAFHATDNPHLIAYSKTPDPHGAQGERLLVIVNLDPHHTQHGHVEVPVDADAYRVRDLLDGTTYTWQRGWNYVRFDPDIRQGHILRLEARG